MCHNVRYIWEFKGFLMKRFSLVLMLFVSLFFVTEPFCTKVQAAQQPYIKSETAVLIEAGTGTVLYDKNMHRQMYPASITKIMTGMLALEYADPNEIMTASHNAVYSLPYNTSHIALFEDENITLEQAMYALGIESANDAANVIAEHIAGTTENFGLLMTQKARELGAMNTNFTNPHGLPEDNHYTTAYDMALITAAAIKTEGFCKYFSTNRYDMAVTNKRDVVRQFWNANYYINGYKECEGLIMSKTGWTEEAQHTLVTVAERDGVTLIAVVMSSVHKGEKYEDTTALLDYGFENFTNIQVSNDYVKENMSADLTFSDGSAKTVERKNLLTDSSTVTVPKGKTEQDIVVKTSQAQLNEAKDMATADVEFYYTDNGASYKCGSGSVAVLMLQEQEKGFDFAAFVQKAVLVVLMVILWIIIVLLVFVVLKQLVIIENRRRIRKRKQAQYRAKRQNGKTVYHK